MSDRIDDLERLQRLRTEGAISDDEFAAEKARLLGDEGRAEAASEPPPRTRWLWPALGAAVAVVLVAVAVLVGRSVVTPEPVATATAAPRPTPAATPAGVASLLPDERLAAAVRAAWPDGATATEGDENFRFDTHRLVDAPFGPVLVSEGRVADAAHVSAGRLDIAYLAEEGDTYRVVRRFPAAITAGSFGQMSEWSVSDKFGRLPMIYAEGGGTWQGYTCGWTFLSELRPDGPAQVAQFMDSYDDTGASVEGGGATAGKIADIVPDRSFDVVFTGTRDFRARYLRKGGRYVLQGGDRNALEGC